MDIESLATSVSNLLPTYDIRIFFISFLFLWSIVLILPSPRFKSQIANKLLPLAIILLYIASLALLVLLLDINTSFLRQYPLLTIPLIYIFLLLVLKISFVFLKSKKNFSSLVKVLTIPIFTLFFTAIFASLLSRPYVTSNTLLDNNLLNAEGKIELTFTTPVRKDSVTVNLSPDTESIYEYKEFLGLNSWITQVNIYPEKSFLPEQKVVVYTTGLKRIFLGGNVHEQSIEYFTPSEPEVKGVSVEDGAMDVAVNTDIVLELDGEDQNFVDWDIMFEPHVKYTLNRDNPKALVLKPEGLKQGVEYKVQILKTIVQYDMTTDEEITRLETELEREIHFTTVSPPGVKDFNRKESIMSNSEPIKIEFEFPLDPNSIEDKFSISPDIEGSISLSDDNKQLIFTPNIPFSKDTKYTIVIKNGLKNMLGGYIEKDITLTFKTPGNVTVLSVIPTNYSSGLLITTKQIAITFNQPVDHSSAQSKFSISPSVKGSFSWSDNTMYYRFSSNLNYGTRYTFSIASGVKSLYGSDSSQKYTYSFTTKNETVTLNVPLYYQSESFTCNLAAARMVLAYKGKSVSEASAKSAIGIGTDPDSSWVDQYGTHWGPLSSYLSNQGVPNTVKRNWNLTDALKEVKAGHPVILYVYNNNTQPKGPFELPGGSTGYKGMHSEVIVGYVGTPENPIQVITNDPWRGKRYLSPSHIKGVWSYIGNTALVIQ